MENKEETPNKMEELKKSVLNESPSKQLEVLINKAKAHINAVKEHVLKYHGKPNHNPYIWLRDKGFAKAEAMTDRPTDFNPDDVLKTLTAILSIKAEQPIVMAPPILERKDINKEEPKKK